MLAQNLVARPPSAHRRTRPKTAARRSGGRGYLGGASGFNEGAHALPEIGLADVERRDETNDLVVNTDQQMLDVCLGDDGLIAGSRPGTVVLLHSTIAHTTLRRASFALIKRTGPRPRTRSRPPTA